MNAAELVEKIKAVQAAFVQYGETRSAEHVQQDWEAERKAQKAAERIMLDSFVALGGLYGEKPPHDHWVKLGGIRSSSTSSFHGAIANWLTNAVKRVGRSA